MQGYIVCEKKGNFPRIHVKICQQRCQGANTCEAYQEFLRTHLHEDIVAASNASGLSSEKGLAAPAL